MPRLATLAPLALGALIGASLSSADASHRTAWHDASDLTAVAQTEAAHLSPLVAQVADPDLRRRLHRSVHRLDDHLGQLSMVIEGSPPRSEPPPLRAITSPDLEHLLSAIDAQHFADDQLAVLRSAIAGRYFRTTQVLAITVLFAFDDDKVEAASMLYDRTIDPQDWYRVLSDLTFSSSRRELLARTSG